MIRDLAGLISLVQIGVLELHPWGSRADDVDHPDRVIFDLDPDPSVSFERVVAAAQEPHDRLDQLGLKSFLKTTRSEEHTSELQSLMRISYAVFCLKKKKET